MYGEGNPIFPSMITPQLSMVAENEVSLLSRLALHAVSLAFHHPHSGEELAFSAPHPADLVEVLQLLRKP
jgi:23S rRNA-/tRNA-specific pseudouridylate synthase